MCGVIDLVYLDSDFHLDMTRVCAAGHSAGGCLALWMLVEKPLSLRGAVVLAAVSGLRRAWELHRSRSVVADLMGGSRMSESPNARSHRRPSACRPVFPSVRFIEAITTASRLNISFGFVATARLHWDDVELMILLGAGHFELVDPGSLGWPHVLDEIPRPSGARFNLRREDLETRDCALDLILPRPRIDRAQPKHGPSLHDGRAEHRIAVRQQRVDESSLHLVVS